MKYLNKVNYAAAIKSLYPNLQEGQDYVICNLGDMYADIIWNADLEKPSEKILSDEVENLKKQYYFEYRLEEYPSIEEWMKAYLQKELDGQTEEWNSLVERREQIKQKYPR